MISSLYSQQQFIYKSNGDSLFFSENKNVKYFEFKDIVSKANRVTIIQFFDMNVDSLDIYSETLFRIEIKNH